MTNPTTVAKRLEETTERQRQASDPSASVWVSANAGTGKTHVLTNRVLRLLLSGTAPERILCITYTKAAAAEMSRRIYDRLADWVMTSQGDLERALHALKGTPASRTECDRARTLFTSAIETPGGLKVLTIHSFCERLLQRFPLESGVAPGFRVIEDKQSKALIREATEHVLTRATEAPESPLGRALSSAIAYASDLQFDDVLNDALQQRQWLAQVQTLTTDPSIGPGAAVAPLLREHFGLSERDHADAIRDAMTSILTNTELRRARDVLQGGIKKDQESGARLDRVLSATSHHRKLDALHDFFFTTTNTPRKTLIWKKQSEQHPDVLSFLTTAQETFTKLHQKSVALDIVAATAALHTIADAVMQAYATAKRRQSALDFPDLIERSVNLLDSDARIDWVHFKLDEGLSHILVDESQDTAPDQWRLINALAREFFSGQGVHDETRTVFAVGDEKQSIYSFQGAAPQEFKKQGAHFKTLATRAQQTWHHVPLTLSFRTTMPVLTAVDQVFANADKTPGVSTTETKITHLAKRLGQEGRVELWPPEKGAGKEKGDPFLPLDEPEQDDATARMAERIAETIAYWISHEESLGSTGQPIKAGDILILVRKRHPIASPIVSALKARCVPVSGADRIELLDQIAIKDVMSLADFLTLPEDDLALAEVLKSPIFGFDDDDLLKLAPNRGRKTLWKMLLDGADGCDKFGAAAETLKRWRRMADFVPPYEFFARLFTTDKVRDRLLARLGPDSGDALDEFVDLTLQFDEQEPPSLSGFLAWLRGNGHEVKRDLEMARDEVRVMTVHGAKGLEAPIVILPDTCGAPGAGRPTTVMPMPDMTDDETQAPPFVWAIKGAGDHSVIQSAKAAQAAKDVEESQRLLYVAMTRARDRLYISGSLAQKSKLSEQSWYHLIQSALGSQLQEDTDFAGRPVGRIDAPQTGDHEAPPADKKSVTPITEMPDWATTPAPVEPQVSIPLAPSRLAPYEIDDEGEPLKLQPKPDVVAAPSIATPQLTDDAHKFLRGNLTHALLQHLPTVPESAREKIATTFVDARGAPLASSTRRNIVDETLNILRAPKFAPLFGAESRAEVPIIATLRPRDGTGPVLKLNGAIDRLVDLGAEIFVVDYKTNRAPAATLEEVAEAYLYQLASYRVALRELYDDKPVRTALLWTDGPRIMEIPSTILDRYENKLWQLKPADLDGA